MTAFDMTESIAPKSDQWVKRVEPDQRWFDAITNAVKQFENTAAEMVAAYEEATDGLPTTERVTDLEMVI